MQDYGLLNLKKYKGWLLYDKSTKNNDSSWEKKALEN